MKLTFILIFILLGKTTMVLLVVYTQSTVHDGSICNVIRESWPMHVQQFFKANNEP